MWPGIPPGRRRRRWAARGARCWPGCTGAGAGWPGCWPRRGCAMDSHDRHGRLLAAFLAGELDPAEARRWDEHLLECDRCWRAVREDRAGRQAAQVLRQPAPPGLADRVAFAVEVAAAGRTAAPRRARRAGRSSRWARFGGWLRWPRLAGAGTAAVAVLVMLVVFMLPGGHQTRSVPAAVAAVTDY